MLPTDPGLRAGMIDFFKRSFVDVADQNYISARILYPYDLKHDFLWAAQQAIEKYLKSILLFNGESAKCIGHDLGKAYADIKTKIKDIAFDIPPDVEKFLIYLNQQGPNRYFEYPYAMRGDELFALDKSVWFIRRYCKHMRVKPHIFPGGQTVDFFADDIKYLQSKKCIENPHKFRIPGGFLEDMLDRKKRGKAYVKLRDALVWKNFYYGHRQKKAVKNFTLLGGSGNPTHFLHVKVFKDLEKVVPFSKDIRDLFAQGGPK